jgi:hypothetical protein
MKQFFFIFYFLFGFFSFCIFAADVGSANHSDPVFKSSNQKRRWTKDEDKRLTDAVKQFGLDWKHIAKIVRTRNRTQCRKHWSESLNPPRLRKARVLPFKAKTPWTPDEDNRLRDAVNQFGPQEWKYIALTVQTRNRTQCRTRWAEYLDPLLKHCDWTEAEDLYIVAQVSKYGSQWAKIAEGLKGRSPGSIKNRWHKKHKSEAVRFLQKEAFPKKRARTTTTSVAVGFPISSANASLPVEEGVLSPLSPGAGLSEAEFAAIAARLLAEDKSSSPTL